MANNRSTEVNSSDEFGSYNPKGLSCTFPRVSGTVFDSTFGTRTWREDASLIVESQELFVSSHILSVVSPVLGRMFENKLAAGRPLKLRLENKSHHGMVELLKCIYPNILKDITLDNVFVVLPLAFEFEIKDLTGICEKVLIQNTGPLTKTEVVYNYLCTAQTYNLTELRRKCIGEAVKKSYHVLQETEKKVPLPVQVKVEIQNSMIDSMEEQMNILKQQNLTYSRRDNILKSTKLGPFLDILRDNVEMDEMKNPRIVFIERKFSLKKGGPLTLYTNEDPKDMTETVVHGIRWFLSMEVEGEGISLFLHAKQKESKCPHKWQCTAYAKVILHNTNDERATIIRHMRAVYNSKQVGYGFRPFAKVNVVADKKSGFVNHEDKMKVEAYVLTEEPTFSQTD